MAITRKKLNDQKRKEFFIKEDNKERKFMTKEEALADNARLKKDREEVAELRRKQREGRKAALKDGEKLSSADIVAEAEDKVEQDRVKEANVAAESKQKEIKKLEAELETVRGPGSKARRDVIREKIAAIQG